MTSPTSTSTTKAAGMIQSNRIATTHHGVKDSDRPAVKEKQSARAKEREARVAGLCMHTHTKNNPLDLLSAESQDSI